MSKKTRLLKILSTTAGITAVAGVGAATVLTSTSCSKSTGAAGISITSARGSITIGSGGNEPIGLIEYDYKGINIDTSAINVSVSPNDVTLTKSNGVVTVAGTNKTVATEHTVLFSADGCDPVRQKFTPLANNSVSAAPYFIYSKEGGTYLKTGNTTNVYEITLQGMNSVDWDAITYSNVTGVTITPQTPVVSGTTSTRTYKLQCNSSTVTPGSKSIVFTSGQIGIQNPTVTVNFTVNPADAEQSYILSIFSAENQLQVDNSAANQILCIKPINNFDLSQQISW